MATYEMNEDDTLSALTGMINSRLLFRVLSEDKRDYLAVRVVLWHTVAVEQGPGMEEGLQAQIHLDGGYVGTSGTVYGLNLSNLSDAADTLSNMVVERLDALGYPVS